MVTLVFVCVRVYKRTYVCTHLLWGQWLHQVEGTVGDVGAASVEPLHGNVGGVKQLPTNLNQVHRLTEGCRHALRRWSWGGEVGQGPHTYVHTTCVHGTINRHTDESHRQYEVLARGTS